MISKKLNRALRKLIIHGDPCIGCFGTKKYHLLPEGPIERNCNCKNIIGGSKNKEIYDNLFRIYTRKCKCLQHVNFNGKIIDKQKVN